MDDNTNTAPKEQLAPATEHGATPAAAAPTTREPEMLNGVKVYPTSYLPVKATLNGPKKTLVSMDLIHIEGIHIGFFILCTIFLFYGMRKRPNLR